MTAVFGDAVAVIDKVAHRVVTFHVHDRQPLVSFPCAMSSGLRTLRLDPAMEWCEVGDIELKDSAVRQSGVEPCVACFEKKASK